MIARLSVSYQVTLPIKQGQNLFYMGKAIKQSNFRLRYEKPGNASLLMCLSVITPGEHSLLLCNKAIDKQKQPQSPHLIRM